MTGDVTPTNGDIFCVVRQHDGERMHVLRVPPGPDQILYRTREQAVAHAVWYAEYERVRAWLVEDGHAAVLLVDHRRIR